MSLRRLALVGLAVGIVLIPTRVLAQDTPPPTRSTFWGFVALGIGGASDSTFYAAGVGAAWQRRSLVLMGRIASVGPEKENRMEDLGLLAGVGLRGFLSLNEVSSFGGLTIMAEVGRLR